MKEFLGGERGGRGMCVMNSRHCTAVSSPICFSETRSNKTKGRITYYVWRWIRQRPVRGKKNPSAAILAKALGIGFWRFCSTAMREEKVRTFSAFGPVIWSAADAAIGCIINFSSCEDKALVGAASSAKALCNLSGRRFEGKELIEALAPVNAASSLPNPANSLAPRLRVVSTEARWPIE